MELWLQFTIITYFYHNRPADYSIGLVQASICIILNSAGLPLEFLDETIIHNICQ
jgi:hypothetical protein